MGVAARPLLAAVGRFGGCVPVVVGGLGGGSLSSTFSAWLPHFSLCFFFAGLGVCDVSCCGVAAWVLVFSLVFLWFLVVPLGVLSFPVCGAGGLPYGYWCLASSDGLLVYLYSYSPFIFYIYISH